MIWNVIYTYNDFNDLKCDISAHNDLIYDNCTCIYLKWSKCTLYNLKCDIFCVYLKIEIVLLCYNKIKQHTSFCRETVKATVMKLLTNCCNLNK